MTSTTTMTVLQEDILATAENPPLRGIRILRTKTTLFVKEDSVSVVESEFICGGSKSGKTWYRWRDINGVYLTYRARGNGPVRLNFYRKELRKVRDGKNQVTTLRNETARYVSLYPFDRFPEVVPAMVALLFSHELITKVDADDVILGTSYFIANTVQKLITRSAYPILKVFSGTNSVPGGITLAAREETIQEFVRVAFGKKRYRKDLVKACAGTSLERIAYAREFRQLVPVDWLIELMRVDYVDYRNGNPHPYLMEILKSLPMNRRRSFLVSTVHVSRWYADDIKNMIDEYSLKHVIDSSKNFTDLHDKLSSAVRRLKTVNQEIAISGYAEKYHQAVTANGLRIVAPVETETVHAWGDKMHNCIGSYAARAVNGGVYLGGVYSDTGLLANFEISPEGKLRQLLGKYNAELTESEQSDILDTLINVKAIHLDTKKNSIVNIWGVRNYVPITEREMITQ